MGNEFIVSTIIYKLTIKTLFPLCSFCLSWEEAINHPMFHHTYIPLHHIELIFQEKSGLNPKLHSLAKVKILLTWSRNWLSDEPVDDLYRLAKSHIIPDNWLKKGTTELGALSEAYPAMFGIVCPANILLQAIYTKSKCVACREDVLYSMYDRVRSAKECPSYSDRRHKVR